jgi:Lipocalin-like domain
MNKLIGRYKLISHGTYEKNGDFTQTSSFLKGELIYSSEGFLSVLIFFNEDNEVPRKFLAYSGSYEIISEKEIVHKIRICNQTKRDQSSEKRTFKLIDKTLILSVDLEENQKFEAKWERI